MTDLAAIREQHVKFPLGTSVPHCDFDAQEWPCDTAQVLAALDVQPVGLDVERLAKALCASRDPIILASDDQFVDDECRTLARATARQYAALASGSGDD